MDAPDGWTVELRERSAGFYEAVATHESGATVQATGVDEDDLIARLKDETARHGSRSQGPRADAVATASAAWVYVPDVATVVETDDFLLVRYPPWFDAELVLAGFHPQGDVGTAIAAALEAARASGLAELTWWVKLDAPPGVEQTIADLGERDETLDVLALDLSAGVPPTGASDVEVRWVLDDASVRASHEVTAAVFGGAVPPEERIAVEAEQARGDLAAGAAALGVAHLEGRPVGSGGVSVVDGVARLWGGSVLEHARGRGAYRALLGARLAFGAEHGARMALVKGRVETSGPILRRAGFEVFGQERSYRVPLTA